MATPREVVVQLVKQSFHDLSRWDYSLLVRDVNERSVAHKFAEYLWKHFQEQMQVAIQKAKGQRQFPDLRVDCEYNRSGDDPKRIPLTDDVLGSNNECYYTPNPDINIHERGNNDHNFFIIEIKKETNADPPLVLLDKLKLVAYMGMPLRYAFGCFLCLGAASKAVTLVEARLMESVERLTSAKEDRDKNWEESCTLLLEDYPSPGRASLRTRFTKGDKAKAIELITQLDDLYQLKDIRSEIEDG